MKVRIDGSAVHSSFHVSSETNLPENLGEIKSTLSLPLPENLKSGSLLGLDTRNTPYYAPAPLASAE